MSARGKDFLEDWIQKNVKVGETSSDPLRASNLAMRCILDATGRSLTLEEIKPDSGSLESRIAEAMTYIAEPGPPAD